MESNSGGYGGSVTGTFWLQQGEKLTYFVGGQEWRERRWQRHRLRKRRRKTSVVSDRKGILRSPGEAVVHLLPETEVPEEVWRSDRKTVTDRMEWLVAVPDTWEEVPGRESFITIRTNAIGCFLYAGFRKLAAFCVC